MSIQSLLDTVKWKCALCGQSGCGCWEKCSCGWSNLAQTFCRNPNTQRCSSKLKYGEWDRSKRAWVPKSQSLLRDLREHEIKLCHPTIRKMVREAWKRGESVPLSVTLLSAAKITDDDIRWANEQIALTQRENP